MSWTLHGWRRFPADQQPDYSKHSEEEVTAALHKVQSLAPLVHPTEIDRLKAQIAKAQEGKAFLLQGGDCAERFVDCNQESIEGRLMILLQMSLVLTWGAKIPIIKMGRLAGQYGKPRSSPVERVVGPDGKEIEIKSFKGDNVNGFDATPESREHDPQRLVDAHLHSACTLNYVRALIAGRFSDLRKASSWSMALGADFKDEEKRTRYKLIVDRIHRALEFMETCGLPTDIDHFSKVDFFTCHEGLVLEYESAVTRPVHLDSHQRAMGTGSSLSATTGASAINSKKASGNLIHHYNLGAHFLWIGNRTRDLNGAHVEYFRGLSNPLGIKVGKDMAQDPSVLVNLIARLNPNNEPGKITLITRLGKGNAATALPTLIFAIKNSGARVLWSCDPMHGNTFTAESGLKTRRFDDVLAELTETFTVHRTNGTFLGGVHLELTGEKVTECMGGPQDLSDGDLNLNYTSYCDPRLNAPQAMEMSFLLAELINSGHVADREPVRMPTPKL